MKTLRFGQMVASACLAVRVSFRRFLCAMVLGATVLSAPAQVVIGPSSIVSNTLGGTAGNLFDQRNVGYTNGVTDFATYVSSAPTGGAYWVSDVFVATGTVIFDLGASYTLSAMALWQGSHFYSQDIQHYQLSISDDFTFTTGVTNLGTFSPAIEPALPSVNTFAPTIGRYVRWEVLSNYGNGFGTHGFEVAFAASGIPEPSTWALLVGLGALAGAWLRRHRSGKRSGALRGSLD